MIRKPCCSRFSNFLDPIQKRAPARSVQLEAVYLEALLYCDPGHLVFTSRDLTIFFYHGDTFIKTQNSWYTTQEQYTIYYVRWY